MEATRQQADRGLRVASGMAAPSFASAGPQAPLTWRFVSRSLREVVLAGTNLSIPGAAALGRAIKHVRGLQLLDVRDCGLDAG
eukprot:4572471-Prymnesium_polylepis.1